MQPIKYLLFIFLITGISCNSENESKEYYPVDAWILAQLTEIDSLPVVITRYKTENSRTDTSLFAKDEFRKLALGLLNIRMNDSRVKKQYEEMVLDEGDNANISIIYNVTNESDLPLRSIQINIKPGQTAPKSIYAERVDLLNDIRIIRKIIWISRKSLLVNSVHYQNNAVKRQITEKFEWGL